MAAINEFWSHLHQLAEVFEQHGLTPDERLQGLLASFGDLPPTVRRQLLADTFRLSLELPDLYAAMSAAESTGTGRKEFWPQGEAS